MYFELILMDTFYFIINCLINKSFHTVLFFLYLSFLNHSTFLRIDHINGSQLAKIKKSITDISLR